MSTLNKIDTVIGVVGIAATTVELMMKTFKWFEKKHGKKDKQDYSRPIIKGL